MDLKNDLRSIADYHHTVIHKATPNVEFTKWCSSSDNRLMTENEDSWVRRANLKRLIERDFHNNYSEIARIYGTKPSYFSDIFREPKEGQKRKSFAEKAARSLERKIGLRRGQLDIPNSQLAYEETRRNRLREELRLEIDGLTPEEQQELLVYVRRMQTRKQDPRRKEG